MHQSRIGRMYPNVVQPRLQGNSVRRRLLPGKCFNRIDGNGVRTKIKGPADIIITEEQAESFKSHFEQV